MRVEALEHLPAVTRRGLYFGLQRAIGSRVAAYWRDFLQWEQYSTEQLEAAVDGRLGDLLTHATENSEYYRQLKLGNRPRDSARAWLSEFPVLSRRDVRGHFAEIVTDALRAEITSASSVSSRRYDWLVVKTGGTTGTPTAVVHDRSARDSGRATRLYGNRLCGFPLGTAYFRLWGSEADLLNQQVSFQQRVLRALLAEHPLNAFRAKSGDLERHIATMRNAPGIKHLMTYVDAAASLAYFIEERRQVAPRFETIMACAGTVTPDFRQLLSRTFQADVYDKYGSRECSDLACECRHHTGLHTFSPHALIEIVDEKGQPCAPGQTGRVLVTLLRSHSFPMIRYEIGDLATWADESPCPCGSPFPRLKALQGRQDDMLITEDGTLQSSVFVRHIVGVSLNRELISQWQLEQTDRLRFVFRFVPLRRDGLPENLEALTAAFRLVFGKAADVELAEVKEILPSPSGKTRWVVNHYHP